MEKHVETLVEFQKRTNFVYDNRSLPESGGFSTENVDSLKAKVSGEGRLLPHHGNTVVFLLEDTVKDCAAKIQDMLQLGCGDFFCKDWLARDTMHVTLHDLVHGAPGEEIRGQIEATRAAAQDVLAGVRRDFQKPVHMKPTAVCSMVNTSVVLCLEPAEKDDCRRLMQMYERFHSVVMPGYPFYTPHITLAYYRPKDFGKDGLKQLRGMLDEINHLRRGEWAAGMEEICLKPEKLVYQEFEDMNHYQTKEKPDAN